jgi:peroxiredoxin family protein
MRAADILHHLSRVARGTPRASHVFVRASDPSFRRDFEAWCANNRGELFGFGAFEDHYLAIVGIHGAAAPAEAFPTPREPLSPVPSRQTTSSLGADDRAHPSRPESFRSPPPTPADFPRGAADFPRGTDSRPDLLRAGIVDLRGQRGEIALLQLGQRVIENGRAEFIGDDPMLGKHLRAWGQAIGAQVELHQDGATFRGLVRIDPRARPTPSLSPAPSAAPGAAQPDGQPLRKNKATIMVLHNDFEPLVAALLTANACVAQGMEVELVFTFWGVNVLRAPVPRGPSPDEKPVPFMKRMMKWMMPAGPDAQQLSKMNMGGMGVEMMKYFMQKDNVMGVRQLMQQAADNGVKFTVCTMSMGVMGIQKSDLLPWPNIEFGGVVSFTSSARESAVSLVF